jgi:putative aldouronate transport system permease protein
VPKPAIADTKGYTVFSVFNHVGLILLALLCVLPMVNVLAVSLSAPNKAVAGLVGIWPVDFTPQSYIYVLKDMKFLTSMWVSVKRVVIGTLLTVFLTVLSAYPLSKSSALFRPRRYYVWYFFFTMLFSGGLVPGFLIVYHTGLLDTLWALVVPGAVSTWNVILMLNFFRQLPRELEEAAGMDGAGHWTILWKVFVPVSKPVIATVTLFTMVGHWNSWFDGMLYMRRSYNYPLQTYLQSLLTYDASRFLTAKEQAIVAQISTKTMRAAQIFIGALPILVVYPFLQRHFAKGIILGSVKG